MAIGAAGETVARARWRWPNGLGIQQWLLGGWTAVVFAFLYLPILLLVAFSFNDSTSRLNLRWEGFTTRWYSELFANSVLIGALENSVIVAVGTTILATILGTLGAWLLFRYRFPFQGALGMLVFIPMVMPEVLMGVSLLILFVTLQFDFGYLTLIIAHTTFCFPFVLVGIQARLEGLDPSIEEAAMDLGARPLQAFWMVVVPYLTPAILAGALMAFTLSFDEYIVTLFTMDSGSQTLPIKIFGMAKKGLNPQLNALSAIIVGVTFLGVLSTLFFFKSKSTQLKP